VKNGDSAGCVTTAAHGDIVTDLCLNTTNHYNLVFKVLKLKNTMSSCLTKTIQGGQNKTGLFFESS